jgi:hypothetical protein
MTETKPFTRVDREVVQPMQVFNTASEIAFLNGLGDHRPNKFTPSHRERLKLLRSKRAAYELRSRWDGINKGTVVAHLDHLIEMTARRLRMTCRRFSCTEHVEYEGGAYCSVRCAMLDRDNYKG